MFSDLKTCPDAYLLWFHHVSWDYKMLSGKTLLTVQEKEAVWWCNTCLLYFQTFSKMSIPFDEKPDEALEYYKSFKFPYAPGN